MRSLPLSRLTWNVLSVACLSSCAISFAACSSDDEGAGPAVDGGVATDSSTGGGSPDGGAPDSGASLDGSAQGSDASANGDGGMADGGRAPTTDDGCVVNLPGDCDAPVAAYSVNAKIVTAYPASSPLFRVVRIPDLATTVVLQAGQGTFQGGSGTPDVTQIAAWLASAAVPGSTAVVTTVFDQSGKGNDATQASPGAAPLLLIDDSVQASAKLSLDFSNEAAIVHAEYVSSPTDNKKKPTNGNNLSLASETNTDPTTATFEALTPPADPGYPQGAPYPLITGPEHWILPGFTIEDDSLPDGGLPVISATATNLVLGGKPSGTSFSDTLNILPENVWLDLPAGVSVDVNHHSLVMAVRSGTTGTPYYLTLGQSGEAAPGAGSFSAFYGAAPFNLANDSQKKAGTPLLSGGMPSMDIDVYEVARSGGTIAFNLGELGSGQVVDNSTDTATLSAGSIGFTQQLNANPEGCFEDYGTLIYPTTLSAHDAAAIQGQMRGLLGQPPVPTTQIVYVGKSTVQGHGIDSVEAPAKRIGVDLAAQGHPARTYTVSELTEDLLADLTGVPGTGGKMNTTVTDLYKSGTGTNVLVIHPTVSDSWGKYLGGQWPSQCLLADGGTLSLEECLWTITSLAAEAAKHMGWKVVILSTEPKSKFFEGPPPTLANFTNLKTLLSNGWQATGASAFADFETIPGLGGSDGKGGYSHCPFWDSYCVGFMDPANTQTFWQPDGEHLSQAGYDASADLIATTLIGAGLY
jgi:hypothetical protein